jgi:hypothetical protein
MIQLLSPKLNLIYRAAPTLFSIIYIRLGVTSLSKLKLIDCAITINALLSDTLGPSQKTQSIVESHIEVILDSSVLQIL